jgi:hypothetical protein
MAINLIPRVVLRLGLVIILLTAVFLPRELRANSEMSAPAICGPANFQEDYLVVEKELGAGLVLTPFLNYEAALRVEPAAGVVEY